jgi:hypothetical protein
MPTGKQRHMTPEEEMANLDWIDTCMLALGANLNLLDPNGSMPGIVSQEVLTSIMDDVRDQYKELSDAILALREKQS